MPKSVNKTFYGQKQTPVLKMRQKDKNLSIKEIYINSSKFKNTLLSKDHSRMSSVSRNYQGESN